MKTTELVWQREKNILLQLEISERLRKFGDDDDEDDNAKPRAKNSAAPRNRERAQALPRRLTSEARRSATA